MIGLPDGLTNPKEYSPDVFDQTNSEAIASTSSTQKHYLWIIKNLFVYFLPFDLSIKTRT